MEKKREKKNKQTNRNTKKKRICCRGDEGRKHRNTRKSKFEELIKVEGKTNQ